MTDYNGWTNYETWNVALWIDNDQMLQGYWIAQAEDALTEAFTEDKARTILADALQADFEDNMPSIPAGPYSDLLNAALGSVDWREIAEHLIQAAKEIGDHE